MTKVLIVTATDYSERAYGTLQKLQNEGYTLSLLSDGSVHPRSGIFEQHFVCDTRRTADTLEFMRNQDVHFDAVLTKSAEQLTPLVALLARQNNAIGNSLRTALLCRSKYHQRCALDAAGLPGIQFRRCRNWAEIVCAVEEIGTPCVAKPVASNSSYGVFLIEADDQMENACIRYEESRRFLSANSRASHIFGFSPEDLRVLEIDTDEIDLATDYVIESFMDGVEISVDSLVQDGCVHPMGIAVQERMDKGTGFFVQLAEWMPFMCSESKRQQILDINEQAIAALGIRNSPVHAELMLTPDGSVKVVEIGARIGSDNIHDAVFNTSGCDLLEEAIYIALGEHRAYRPQACGYTAMQYILPTQAGILECIEVPEALRLDPNITEVVWYAQAGDYVAPPPESFEYLGYLQARGSSPTEAQENLALALNGIRYTLK